MPLSLGELWSLTFSFPVYKVLTNTVPFCGAVWIEWVKFCEALCNIIRWCYYNFYYNTVYKLGGRQEEGEAFYRRSWESQKLFFSGQIVIELELEFPAKESLKYIICMASFENVLATFKIMTIKSLTARLDHRMRISSIGCILERGEECRAGTQPVPEPLSSPWDYDC